MNSFKQQSVSPTLHYPLLLFWQPKSSHNSLKIVVAVVLDFNPAALVSMMNGDMRSEMFLQAVLQIFNCCWHDARLCSGASSLSSYTADPEQAGHQSLRPPHSGIATQDCFCGQELFLGGF